MFKYQLLVVLLVFIIVKTKGHTWQPNVMVVLLVRNKAHLLNNTLKFLENQDYPKDKIGLFIRSDHNEDNTDEILATWLKSQKGRGIHFHRKLKLFHDALQNFQNFSEILNFKMHDWVKFLEILAKNSCF